MICIYRPRRTEIDFLTPEKLYNCEWNRELVYSSDGIYYKLINDLGIEVEVHESNLVRLDDLREEKLKKIGII